MNSFTRWRRSMVGFGLAYTIAVFLMSAGPTRAQAVPDDAAPQAILQFVETVKPEPDQYHQKVTVLVGALPAAQNIKWLAPAIKKAYDIDVEIVRVPIGQLPQSIMSDATTGGTYDIYLFPPRMLGDLVADGHLVNLDTYAKKWDPLLNDVFPAYRELYNYWNGSLYTLTMDGDRLELYYRSDLFTDPGEQAAFKSQFGYSLGPPQTWEQYLDVAKFFTRKPGDLLAGHPLTGPFFGMSEIVRSPNVVDWWVNRFAAYGGVYFDSNLRPQLNTAPGIKALDNFKHSLAFGPPGILNFDYTESYDAFVQGNTAMVIQWSDVAKGAENPKSSKVVGKVGYAQIPGEEVGGTIRHRSTLAYSRVFGISTKSKVPEAAYRVIHFLHSPQVSILYVTQFGGLDPFRASAYVDPAKWVAQWSQLPAYIDNTLKSIRNGYPELTISGAVRYQDTLGQQIARALAGEVSSEQALVEAERQWNTISDELDRDLQKNFWKEQLATWQRVGLAP